MVVPRALFPWLWRWGSVTMIWASPRFGHPHSHIPSFLAFKKHLWSSPGRFSLALEVGRCHSDMGIPIPISPAFWVLKKTYGRPQGAFSLALEVGRCHP